VRKLIEKLLDNSYIYGFFQFLVRTKRASEIKKISIGELVGIVLDFGSGNGDLADLIEAERYVGIEPLEGCITRSRKRFPNHQFIHGDHRALSVIPPSSVNSVVFWGVWHHLGEQILQNVLEECFRVLSPQGIILALEPVSNSPKTLADFVMKFDRGAFIRSENDYMALLKSNNFQYFSISLHNDLVRIPYRSALISARKPNL
jgi:ubiquinone/menaquinone biosynthesis C-methylase UbiE